MRNWTMSEGERMVTPYTTWMVKLLSDHDVSNVDGISFRFIGTSRYKRRQGRASGPRHDVTPVV